VQITDFGLARVLNPKNKLAQYTTRVITLWYRAPEVLLGFGNYSFGVDMWSIGCVFVELITGQVLFRAGQETQAIDLIFQVCGTPTEQTMPGLEKQRLYLDYRAMNPATHECKLTDTIRK
jgi:serine/threonine protein kinase